MLRHILFDFDGTLVASGPLFIDCYNKVAAENGFKKIAPENVEAIRNLPMKERFRYLQIPLYRLPFLTVRFMFLYKRSCKDLKLIDGMKALLAELKVKGYGVSILSTNAENIIREVLQKNEIYTVDKIYSSAKLFGKGRLLKKFLRITGLTPSEVIYIGDEVRDIEAGKDTGVKVIWVSWGYDNRKTAMEKAPDYMVDRQEEIMKIILTGSKL